MSPSRLVLALLLAASFIGPSGKIVGAQPAASSLRLFSVDGSRLTPLDPMTLGVQGTRSLDLSDRVQQVIQGTSPGLLAATNGGRTVMIAEYLSGRPVPQSLVLRELDARTGAEVRRFHAARYFSISGMSANGSQIYGWWPNDQAANGQTFYVISGIDGHLLHKIDVKRKGCCFDRIYDPAAGRLYLLVEPQVWVGHDNPKTPVLTAIDVATGHRLARLRFPGLLAGSWATRQTIGRSANGVTHYAYADFSPALTISPDGRTLAIVDGARDEIFLIDARRLAVTRVESMAQPQGVLARLAGWLGLLPTAAEAKEFEGVLLNAYFSPDGSRLYVEGMQGTVQNRVWKFTYLGIRAVDVASGQITGWVYRDQRSYWMMPAPDGSAVYAEIPSSPQGDWSCPCHLQRLDPVSLAVQAERVLDQPIQLTAWVDG
jgi:hypothetical protein